MNTAKRIQEGSLLFSYGKPQEFFAFLEKLKDKDPLAHSVLELAVYVLRHEPERAIRKGTRLISKISDKQEVLAYLFVWLGRAYRLAGELEAAENYFLKAINSARAAGDSVAADEARMGLMFNLFLKARYDELHREAESFLKGKRELPVLYLEGTCWLIKGKPWKAAKIFNALLEELTPEGEFWASVLEMRGLARRLTEDLQGAADDFLLSAQTFLKLGSRYAAYPLAKALEINLFIKQTFPESGLIEKCLRVARGGTLGEQAAACEIEGLLKRDIQKVLKASDGFLKAFQHMEALLAAGAAAKLSWEAEIPGLARALKIAGELVASHPGFYADPLFGKFFKAAKELAEPYRWSAPAGILATLLGRLRVWVRGREIQTQSWGNRKALLVLVYLLLAPNHRLREAHLMDLLWPDKPPGKAKNSLHVAVSVLRKRLGDASLLSRVGDYYQLEGDVKTDLARIEALVREAEASLDPKVAAENLKEAAKLCRDELLPEFAGDPFVEQYREYYQRLRNKVFRREKRLS